MGLTGLYADYRTPLANLQRVRHEQLARLLKVQLVEKNFLSSDYLKLMKELRQLREYANYPFGDDIILKDGKIAYLNLKLRTESMYSRTGIAFDFVIDFITNISDEISDIQDLLSYIRLAIGDVIGEDLFDTYLSKIDINQVNNYLVEKNLTT